MTEHNNAKKLTKKNISKKMMVHDDKVKFLKDAINESLGNDIDIFVNTQFNETYNANSNMKTMYEIIKSHAISCLSYEILLFNQKFDIKKLDQKETRDTIINSIVCTLMTVGYVGIVA